MVSALPIYAMCCIRVPFTILDHFEKSGRSFLWYGNKINNQGDCLVKWDTICLPKKAGGLGVLDLRTQNRALLIKFLFKFFNKHDIPWVELIWNNYYSDGSIPSYPTRLGSFSWRDCCSILQDFKSMTTCIPSTGNTISLWHDKWNEDTLQSRFPHLYSFSKDSECTIASAIVSSTSNFYEMFHLPMSSMAVQQSNEMLEIISNIHQDNDNKDCWQFLWKGNKYSNRKIYLHLIGNPPKAAPPFQWIWKSCSLPKQKFFFWLLLLDRLNTRDLLIRKNFQIENRRCILCDDEPNEYLQHLL